VLVMKDPLLGGPLHVCSLSWLKGTVIKENV
jgi:hypothetical protein